MSLGTVERIVGTLPFFFSWAFKYIPSRLDGRSIMNQGEKQCKFSHNLTGQICSSEYI